MVKAIKFYTYGAGVWLYVVAASAAALGLGEIQVFSHLGRPLEAYIPLVETSGQNINLEEVTVHLADLKAHSKEAIGYPYSLNRLRFEFLKRTDGRHYLKLSTPQSLHEPLLNFLIDFRWPKGHIFKEIIILLDPPTYVQRTSGSSESSSIHRAQVADKVTDIQVAPTSNPTKDSPSDGRYGPVAAGENLSEIAARLQREAGVSIFKMMRALYNRNPHAFGSGMDFLKQGVMLQIPTSDELAEFDVDNKPVAMVAPAERNDKLGTVPGSEKPQPVGQQVSREPEVQNAGQGPRLLIVKAEVEEGVATDATNRIDQMSTDIDAPEQISNESQQSRQRLHQAEHELEALRKDNQSMRESMAQLQNQLLLTQTRLDQLLNDFQTLVKATKASPAEAMPPSERPPVFPNWLRWLLGLAVAGLLGGLALIYWKKWRGQNTLLGARRAVREEQPPVNLDEILDSVQANDDAHQVSSDLSERPAYHAENSEESSITQQLDTLDAKVSEAKSVSDGEKRSPGQTQPLEAARHEARDPNGHLITEYFLTGELSLTDNRIQQEIVEREGNEEVKLLLLTFYKEKGLDEELKRVAEDILARIPDQKSEFRGHVMSLLRSIAHTAPGMDTQNSRNTPSRESANRMPEPATVNDTHTLNEERPTTLDSGLSPEQFEATLGAEYTLTQVDHPCTPEANEVAIVRSGEADQAQSILRKNEMTYVEEDNTEIYEPDDQARHIMQRAAGSDSVSEDNNFRAAHDTTESVDYSDLREPVSHDANAAQHSSLARDPKVGQIDEGRSAQTAIMDEHGDNAGSTALLLNAQSEESAETPYTTSNTEHFDEEDNAKVRLGNDDTDYAPGVPQHNLFVEDEIEERQQPVSTQQWDSGTRKHPADTKNG